jgi:hypothetical protein
MNKYCAQCHHDTLAVEDFNILDYNHLTDPATHLIVPGEPDKSLVWIRTGIKNDMPPRKIHLQPNPEERQIIKDWIDAGAPPFTVPANMPAPSPRSESIPVAALAKLRETMKKIAKQILANTGEKPVSVGQFTPTGIPHTSAGVVLETILSVELEDIRKGVVQATAPYEVKGDYFLVTEDNIQELKEMKFVVRLIETQSGDELMVLRRDVQLGGGHPKR